MLFPVKTNLTPQEIQQGLRAVLKDGLMAQAVDTLTAGMFLVAFALQLGASNFMIGLLAAIPPLAHLTQIPAVLLIEKFQNRRLVAVLSSSISRSFLLVIALIPVIAPPTEGLWILVMALLLNSIAASIASCGWHSWMRDLIPEKQLGQFFAKRKFIAAALGVVLAFLVGNYLDYWKAKWPNEVMYSYSILFVVAFFAGVIGIYFLSTTPEPQMIPSRHSFFKIMLQPFKDQNFKNLVIFLGSWNFAINLAAPFFTVYMLKRLQLDMGMVVLFSITSQIMNLSFLRIWGRFSDRYNNKSVFSICSPLFLFSILMWAFTTLPDTYFLTIPLLIVIHLIMGLSSAGMTLASLNIGFKLAPKGNATPYLASLKLVNALTAGIAPILGGIAAHIFAKYELSWTLKWISPGTKWSIEMLNLQHWDFFFVIAFIMGLYSLHRLSLVNEVGTATAEDEVLLEMLYEVRREVRDLSSAAGIRQMVEFPFSILKQWKQKNNLSETDP
ncbi:MAG: MFS transporter [SAR324 cluster bacterium]|nr:MFS transporter [SAR324 cluster bacterium]